MKVRTRLYLSSISLVLVAISFFLVVNFSSTKIRQAMKEHEFARGMQKSISQLNIVMYEYVHSKKERAKEQWLHKYQSINEQFQAPQEANLYGIREYKFDLLSELLDPKDFSTNFTKEQWNKYLIQKTFILKKLLNLSEIGQVLKHKNIPDQIKEDGLKRTVQNRWELFINLSTKSMAIPNTRKATLQDMIYEDFQMLGTLFNEVIDNFENQGNFIKKGGSIALMAATLEVENQVSDLLLIKSYSIIQDTSRVAQLSLKRLNQVQDTADRVVILFVCFLIIILMITSFAVAHSISSPIQKLIRGTKKFGQGDLDHRIRIRSKDELGQLATAFNAMSQSLQEKMDALEKTNKELKIKNDQIQEELEIATRIHKTLIPESIHSKKADVTVNYIPVSYIGGDYAKVHFIDDDRLIFIISDVTGHGVGAALLVNRLHAEFERLAKLGKKPGHLLKDLNEFITNIFEGTSMYVSAFCGYLDFNKEVFQYSNYGHPSQYIYRSREKKVQSMESQTTLLGIPFHDEVIHQHELPFTKGDKILLFTDGVVEAKSESGEMYGLDRMEAFLQKHYEMPPTELNQQLLKELDSFQRDTFEDDVFLLTIQINP